VQNLLQKVQIFYCTTHPLTLSHTQHEHDMPTQFVWAFCVFSFSCAMSITLRLCHTGLKFPCIIHQRPAVPSLS
jgi:hypothetical protein